MRAHFGHEVSEALDLAEQGGVVQVAEDLLAVAHGVGVAQMTEQGFRYEVTLFAVPRDRRHHLVEVQVPREGAVFVPFPGFPRPRCLPEQQAGASHVLALLMFRR